MTRILPTLFLLSALSLAACGPAASEPTIEAIASLEFDRDEEPASPPTGTPSPAPTDEQPAQIEEATAMPDPTQTPAPAGVADADVTFVRALLKDDGTWTFYVTVLHPDTGWEDYADGWDVVLPDGTVLLPNAGDPFTRLLLHPHVGEQPFVRSQSGIIIPEGVATVTVRAHDLVDGFGGQEVTVDLTTDEGPNYVVDRT